MQLVDTLADLFFPPRHVGPAQQQKIIRASTARVDRHVLFRSAWEPDFGTRLQLALRDLSEFCARSEPSHFANLAPARQEAILEALEVGSLAGWTGTGPRDAKTTFDVLYDAISAGLFAEPGYGGNAGGLGWQYANFIAARDLA